MRLVIDVGNTFFKGALFDETNMAQVFEPISVESDLANWINSPEIDSVWISTVRKAIPGILINDRFPVKKVHHTLKLPFNLDYKTPETLGTDRIAAVAGAINRFPDKNLLVINLGTCITFDVLTADKNYLGGAISPGIFMRFKSLKTFTASLPEASLSHYVDFIGKNTLESLASGVFSGIFSEIIGYTHRVEKQFGSVQLVISGGDHIYFDNLPIKEKFASPWLVLEGINHLAQLNE